MSKTYTLDEATMRRIHLQLALRRTDLEERRRDALREQAHSDDPATWTDILTHIDASLEEARILVRLVSDLM